MLSNGQYAPLSIRPRPRRHRPPQSYLNGGLFSYSPLHGPVSGITMLSNNQLSGEIPPELGRLTNLEYLYISGTSQLRGCIPSGLQSQLEESRFPESYSMGRPFCP